MKRLRHATGILTAWLLLIAPLAAYAVEEPNREASREVEQRPTKEPDAFEGPRDRQEGRQQAQDKVSGPVPTEESRKKEAEETKRLTELFLRTQSVFLRKGELMVELNTFYNKDTQDHFTRVQTGVVLTKTTRRFFDTTIIARYGLFTDGLELDVIAPVWIHAEQESDFGTVRAKQVADGVGDIAAAIRYQVWYERGSRPSLILDVEGKSRTGDGVLTGTGHWNAGGGVTLLKTIDPVVLFGRIGYAYTFARPGRNLGNIIDYRLGMGFSLNDRVSFTMQLTGAFVGPSEVTIADPTGAAGSFLLTSQRLELMNLLFTTTVLVTKKFFIEPVVGVGLTDQAFDAVLGLRLPYRF